MNLTLLNVSLFLSDEKKDVFLQIENMRQTNTYYNIRFCFLNIKKRDVYNH